MTAFRACTVLLMVGALWFVLTLLAGCAAHLPPMPSPPPSMILISENAPPEVRVCVLRSPFLDGSFACMSVGELRQMLRGRRLA